MELTCVPPRRSIDGAELPGPLTHEDAREVAIAGIILPRRCRTRTCDVVVSPWRSHRCRRDRLAPRSEVRRLPHERAAHPFRSSTRGRAVGLVQHHAGPGAEGRAAPAVEPADEGAPRARGPGAALPDDADHAGGLDRPVDRHPGPGHRHLPAVEADPAVPCDAAGAGAADTPARIYFKYEGRVAGRVAQAEHRGAAGVLQQGGGHPPDRHRDGRRAMGIGDGHGVQHLRARRARSTW